MKSQSYKIKEDKIINIDDGFLKNLNFDQKNNKRWGDNANFLWKIKAFV